VSYVGDSLGLVALMLHVAETTGRALAVAWLLLAGDFAPALLGPLAGTVADRLDRRRVMVGCELLQAVLVLATALWLPPLPALLALVGLRAVAGQVFQPASRAAVPALVPERDLERANAAVGVATNGGETLGPLVAAVLLPVLEVRGVLLVDAATFGVSAVLLGFLPAMGTSSGLGRQASFLADAGAGLGYLWRQPTVRAVTLGYLAIVACNGIDDVALVFLATDTLGGGAGAVGLLLAAVGLGLLAGYGLLARTRGRLPMTALLLAGFAVSSAGNLLTGLAWAVAAAFAVQAVRGLGIAALDVAATTLVQRIVPARLLGRVFGSLYGGIGVAAALAYLLGGLLLDRTGPRVAFVAAGAAGLLAAGATALALRHAANRS
jgi:MFS family permease